jgi:HlyD family secretion protein
MATAFLLAAGGGFFYMKMTAAPVVLAVPSAASARNDIVARGHIEPASRVRAVTGITEGGTVRQLFVARDDNVKAGQVLAVLDGFDLRKADYELAQRNLALSIAQRAQVDAGAKSSDIAAQSNIITAKQAKLLELQQEWQRQTTLYSTSVVSKQSMDTLKAQLAVAQQEVDQAQNALKSLSEVRSVDDQVAAAQIEVNKVAVDRAQVAMERLEIRAPIDGTILSVEARPGEAVQADGILRMADMSHLIVIADVDETEIGKVKLGERARIEGYTMPHSVSAVVTQIAHEVYREKRPVSDILVGRDAKIVEVELSPDSPLPPDVGSEVEVHLIAGPASDKVASAAPHNDF